MNSESKYKSRRDTYQTYDCTTFLNPIKPTNESTKHRDKTPHSRIITPSSTTPHRRRTSKMFPPGGKPRYRRNQCNNSNRRGGIIHRFMRDRI